MIGSNNTQPRPFRYIRRNVYFIISLFLTTAFSGMFEMAYAREFSILEMLNNTSSARIVDLTVNRTGMIQDMSELLHGADGIQIVPKRTMAFISQGDDFYILHMDQYGEIEAVRIKDICRLIPWLCITNPHASADTTPGWMMRYLDEDQYFPGLR